MKHILCFGDSNTWGHNPQAANQWELRYKDNERWTGMLAYALEGRAKVIEEGLCGRSTMFDDPLTALCNGTKELPLCLKSHQPLDIIVFMLGTNDARAIFGANVKEIGRGMEHLIKIARSPESYDIKEIPEILLIAPPLLGEELKDSYYYGIYDEQSMEKLKLLGAEYEKLAKQYQCEFLDAGTIIKTVGRDGIHFTKEGHRLLYKAVLNKLEDKWLNEK